MNRTNRLVYSSACYLKQQVPSTLVYCLVLWRLMPSVCPADWRLREYTSGTSQIGSRGSHLS